MLQSVFELLGEDGPLARDIPGFTPRLQQQEMAEAISEAIASIDDGDVPMSGDEAGNGVLIAEAGTGTGKTFAYLVPALMSGTKVIISTGTRNLQDQLFHRDLPAVRNALGVSVKTALLKGRSNYACHHRLELRESEGLQAPAMQDQLASIRQWMGRTRAGDIAELGDIPEDAMIWPLITSTADNCLGTDCPAVSDCFVLKARRAAQEADVLVVNHHLFFADMSLRDEGFGEVLPGANAFIFDEAHQLSDVAIQYFGVSLSHRQLVELARDASAEVLNEAPDLSTDTRKLTDALDKAARDFRLSLGDSGQRSPWGPVSGRANVAQAMETLCECMEQLNDSLADIADRAMSLEKCAERSADLLVRLRLFADSDPGSGSGTGDAQDDSAAANSGSQQTDTDKTDPQVLWFETHQRGFLLRKTPTSIAKTFAGFMAAQRSAWVFTSATLSVAGKFNHFARGLGLRRAHTHLWESPFDFEQQALMYLPQDLPEPGRREYTDAIIDAAIPVIEASGGRAFFLVTSYRALNEIAERLEDEIQYPLLVQGTLPRPELLDRFRELGNAVLVGTSSFWEGVDVRGEALSCVIIDKLPFAHPDEPVLQARIEWMRRHGANPFFDYQIPQAVISLKQGVGRLIRGTEDRGVLMLCDPRLLSKPYGRIFLNSLPSIPRTRDLKDIEHFFKQ